MPRKRPASYERVRGSKACAFCSRRKIKCDGGEPCAVCQTRLLQCVYVKGRKRGPPPKHVQDQCAKPPPSPSNNPWYYAESSKTAGSDQVDGNDDDHDHDDKDHGIDESNNDDDESSQTSTKRPRLHPAPALDEVAAIAHFSPPYSLGPGPALADGFGLPAAKPSYLKSSGTRIPISHQELESLLTLPSCHNTTLAPRSTSPRQAHHADHIHNTFTTAASSVSADSPLKKLSIEAIDQLLTIYQSFVHLHWPIIYLPSFSSLRALETSHPLLFHAVLAVAAGTQESSDAQATSAHHSAPRSAARARAPRVCRPGTAAEFVDYLQNQVHKQDLPTTLETIQVLVLLALVEMGGGATSDAYMHATTACVLAIDLGLHRRLSASRSAQPARPEEKQRVLWGCYVLDKTLAAALERPMMLRRNDLDVDLPSTEERDEYDLFVNDRSRHYIARDRVSTMADVKCRCISSFRAHCELMMRLEQILHDVYSPKAKRDRKAGETQGYMQSVVKLDAQLKSWRTSLPQHLQWSSELDPSAQEDVPPQMLTMRAWYSACILLLHRPRLPLNVGSKLPILFPANGDAHPRSVGSADKVNLTVPGSILVKAAAAEICYLLSKYQATFSVRRIPSSWVYLLFQSAVIHSSFLEKYDLISEGETPDRIVENGNSNESERLFRHCVRNLEQIALTWRGASHHVATLRRVVESCRNTRPSTPVLGPATAVGTRPSDVAKPTLSLVQPATMLHTGAASESQIAGSHDFTWAAAPLDSVLDPAQHLTGSAGEGAVAGAGGEWLDFWSQMPSSSEDVWLWQQFIDSFGVSSTGNKAVEGEG